jgi:hypothetical protein
MPFMFDDVTTCVQPEIARDTCRRGWQSIHPGGAT